MKLELSSLARSGLVALGLLAGMPLAAHAGPADFARMAAPQVSAGVTQIQYRNDGWRGNGWRGNAWRGGGWNGRYNNDWRWRHYRPFHPNYFGGSGIYFNFNIPAYRYYEPRYYQPRRVYRSGSSSAHVQWCYNRYRSYQAWDNSFQPYNGPRQECWSPYR